MSRSFNNTIRELREKHFPGRSIRSLQNELEDLLGEHFYTYVSKLEAGLLPSVDFLKKISLAYKLTDTEQHELLEAYLRQKFDNEMQRSGIELQQPILFRKIKRKK